MDYYNKLKNFNKRRDYENDVNIAKLFFMYLANDKPENIFIIGTGLGADTKIVKGVKYKKIIGVEPRKKFFEESLEKYEALGGRLYEMDLGKFVTINKTKMSGIFLFIHSINHIPLNQLKLFTNSISKNSKIIIINPNPIIGKILGKTDKTVITYLGAKKIQNILKSDLLFDFFYHPIKIKNNIVPIREAILLKRN